MKNQLPTIQELISESEMDLKQNALMVILNQNPPDAWFENHPTAKIKNAKGENVSAKYLSIGRIEYLLSRIYGKWWVDVKNVQVIANSVAVTVRLFVNNPLTGEIEFQDGVGATPIQTDSGKGAMDWNFAKSAGVQMALPSARSYAIKNAAGSFGKIFGKDVNRALEIDYLPLLKQNTEISDLIELFELKKSSLNDSEIVEFSRILDNNEKGSFNKLFKILKSK